MNDVKDEDAVFGWLVDDKETLNGNAAAIRGQFGAGATLKRLCGKGLEAAQEEFVDMFGLFDAPAARGVLPNVDQVRAGLV